jgi:protein-S-isoprenylcysteine O-methyltransferase Ste14
MNSARYVFAMLLLLGLAPGLMLWFFIHPIAPFWRRLGAGWTYSIVALPSLTVMAVLFWQRDTLLAVEYGTNWVLVALSAVVMVGVILLARQRARLLTAPLLVGMPEISPRRYPGTLITEGVYSRIRHPRYVEIMLAVLAYALFSNYLASYLIFLFGLPVVWLIVLLEERELRQRFGAEYEAYARRVPRFFPKLGTRSSAS